MFHYLHVVHVAHLLVLRSNRGILLLCLTNKLDSSELTPVKLKLYKGRRPSV